MTTNNSGNVYGDVVVIHTKKMSKLTVKTVILFFAITFIVPFTIKNCAHTLGTIFKGD